MIPEQPGPELTLTQAPMGPHGVIRLWLVDGSVIDCTLGMPWHEFIDRYLHAGIAFCMGMIIERRAISKIAHLMPNQPMPMATVAEASRTVN